MTSTAHHWESRNGYVPPPRFQQLRAFDQQQQQLQNQFQQQPNHIQFPSHSGRSSPSGSPQMSHTRSPSFSFFRSNKQKTDVRSSVHQRASSNVGNGPPNQQYPNNFSAGPRLGGQPPPQNNMPPSQYGLQGPPQPPPNLAAQPQPAPAQKPPPPPQQQTNKLQRPQQSNRQPSTPNMGHSATPSQQSAMTRTPSLSQQANAQQPQPPTPAPLHPEIRSVVQLNIAHAHKIYFSGPLVRRMERQPDGQKPHKDDGWNEIWAQLGGTTLSVWDMKEIQEASKQGKEVPPSYVNVTDAFVQVLGSVTVPATPTVPSKRYTNVLTLNTAGSNLLLFSCPSTAALISWAAALRLAAWEKSRLEEIYTAHLIRITLSARDIPTTLVRGKMEGWARIRIAGQTDWKRVWLCVQEGSEAAEIGGAAAAQAASMKGKRMSNLFSRNSQIPSSPMPQKPTISMFASPKPKDKKKALLTLSSVTQAFGVYPERPELISKSTLMKIEGTFGDEDMAGSLRTREGWTLIMPELENNMGQAAEMLKWIVALHDSFELYGRPEAWTWDPRDPKSLMYGYPVGPQKENLFLDRELVESMDPRDDRTSVIREALNKLLEEHMKPAVQAVPRSPNTPPDMPPSLPPIGGMDNSNGMNMGLSNSQNNLPPPPPPHDLSPGSMHTGSLAGPQLPHLSFGGASPVTTTPIRERPLTTIKEGGSVSTTTGSMLNAGSGGVIASPPGSSSLSSPPLHEPQSQQSDLSPSGPSTIMEGPISHSPQPTTPTSLAYGGLGSPSTISHALPSAGVTTQTSKSSLDKSVASPPSTTPATSPKLEDRQFYGRTSSPASPPPPPPPIPAALSQRSASPASARSPSHPSFLVHETRTMTQDTVSTQAEVTSLEPISDADQRHASPKVESPSWNHPPSGLKAVSTARSTPTEEPNDFMSEAGALYYMQQSDMGVNPPGLRQHILQQQRNAQAGSDEDESSSFDEDSEVPPKNNAAVSPYQQQNVPLASSSKVADTPHPHQPVRRGTPMAFTDNTSTSTDATAAQAPPSASLMGVPVALGRLSPTSRSGLNLGRKPSGARAPKSPAPRSYNGAESLSSHTVTETDESMDSPTKQQKKRESAQSDAGYDDVNGEALAALTYLDIADSQDSTTAGPSSRSPEPTPPALAKVEPLRVHSPEGRSLSPSGGGGADPVPYKSSFAPSNKAAERKAKAQAQQAAHHAAVHKPGRANGKRKSRVAGAWESSDEEEEDEEEEDEEVDSDGEAPRRGPQSASSHQMGPGRPQIPQIQTGPSDLHHPQHDISPATPSHLRPARNLPQIPGGRGPGDDFQQNQPIPRRPPMDQYNDSMRRTYYDDGTQIRSQSEFPAPGAARQNVWSQVLDPGRAPGRPDQQPSRDTFVQLDPAETMTKAFTPQGLLSAGIQDKEDRSAKRQEELARESGGSLINVPNKPPPPQTGLLGAITAHERERKREGGVGAALTEREREKRVAEERQRRFDDQQRQQMDQMQQGGSMYGGQFGYNPMMNPMMMGMMGMNPMMTGGGMNPMMTGGGLSPMMTGGGMTPQMGYPGMMGGFNPHMFAAQQAAQAYQQAMMAFSVAGSQAGGEGGNSGASPPSQMGGMGGNNTGNINPMNTNMNPAAMGAMSPGMTGGMGGYDPRMSMMGMPMMGMGMGGMGMGGMGMPSQMGSPMGGPMGGQMGGQAPLGMQMTGVSGFDPRASPANGSGSPHNPNDSGLYPPNQSQFSASRNSSPAGRGSPLARGQDTLDRGRPSRPTSPK